MSDVLALLPCHLELLRALTAYDLVGFQTERDLRNFGDWPGRFLHGGASADGGLLVGDRSFRAGLFPLGIDTARFEELAASPGVEKLCEQMRHRLLEVAAIAGDERLDYTEGLRNACRSCCFRWRRRRARRCPPTPPCGRSWRAGAAAAGDLRLPLRKPPLPPLAAGA